MALLTVDQDKCNKDGFCSMDCPVGIIQLNKEGDGFPVVAVESEAFCMKCGHCVAVCPHGALDNSKVPRDVCPKVGEELTVGADHPIPAKSPVHPALQDPSRGKGRH